MSNLAINVENVVKSFPAGDTRTYALKGATLDAKFGELLMIVGPSGCGKTTLLSVICGTLKCEEGRLTVFDHDLRAMKEGQITRFRCENVGFIFQQFNLIPTLTAVENASVPLILNGVSTAEATRRAGEVLEKVGIGEKRHSYPSQLSGGQQQRVAIARALAHEPRLIICDEPTASLDAATGQKTLDLLKSSALQPDRCVIVVSHDNRIYHFADRIAEMEDGRVTGIHNDPKNYHHA
ncbi:MAG: ABC transporter ATP-binding protein [Verrucomicrobiaceae bacterium]|nr:MAG: ABC transporter ATP-binding protein [Verrucomicrobiaceae bacterium]